MLPIGMFDVAFRSISETACCPHVHAKHGHGRIEHLSCWHLLTSVVEWMTTTAMPVTFRWYQHVVTKKIASVDQAFEVHLRQIGFLSCHRQLWTIHEMNEVMGMVQGRCRTDIVVGSSFCLWCCRWLESIRTRWWERRLLLACTYIVAHSAVAVLRLDDSIQEFVCVVGMDVSTPRHPSWTCPPMFTCKFMCSSLRCFWWHNACKQMLWKLSLYFYSQLYAVFSTFRECSPASFHQHARFRHQHNCYTCWP